MRDLIVELLMVLLLLIEIDAPSASRVLKVMSAIERCRTAAFGGHVARCEKCDHIHIAYNSCRNRHCPKCQGAAAKAWLADREAELLPACRVHAAGAARRHRLPEQGSDLAPSAIATRAGPSTAICLIRN